MPATMSSVTPSSRRDARRRAPRRRSATDAYKGLENDLDGWHYPPGALALGQLAARYPERFGAHGDHDQLRFFA
jgi:hypothetical protein